MTPFLIFAILTVGSALLLVLSRNTVNSAMFLILSFVGTAGLFVLLSAFLLAVLQILVYAGAVVVLFLFIIMLLDVEADKKVKFRKFSLGAGLLGLGLLTVAMLQLFVVSHGLPALEPAEISPLPPPSDPLTYATAPKSFGYSLFTKYMLPFQVIGFLLLLAMIGVVLISKKYDPGSAKHAKNPKGNI